MKFNLAALLRRKNRGARIIALRPIEVTANLEAELDRIVRGVTLRWLKSINELILPLFTEASEQLTQEQNLNNIHNSTAHVDFDNASWVRTKDAPADPLRTALSMSETEAIRFTLSIDPRVRDWLERLDKWHASNWSSRVFSSTGVDIFPFLDLNANSTQIQVFQARISSLIRGLNDETRRSIEEVVWKGFLEQQPRREMGKILREKIAISRRRANFIASDQSNKTAAEMTKLRQEEAGIEKFVWETAKDDRVRPEHAALQGKIFRWDSPPSIGLPGTPPRCRCTGRAYIELEAEVENA